MTAQPGGPSAPGTAAAIFLLWCLVAGVIFYWYTVLTGQGVQATLSYLDFSRAFPPADALMAASAAACAEHLRRRRAGAVLWALLTAGALAFVGVVDITYNFQHDIYDRWSVVLVWEVYVNLFSLIFPAWLARFAWIHRRVLDPDPSAVDGLHAASR